MSEVIMIVSPGKWVSEEQLIALKGGDAANLLI